MCWAGSQGLFTFIYVSMSRSGIIPALFSLLMISIKISSPTKQIFHEINPVLNRANHDWVSQNSTYHFHFQCLDNMQRSQVFPSQSFQRCACHIGSYNKMSSEVKIHSTCIHCKRCLQWPRIKITWGLINNSFLIVISHLFPCYLTIMKPWFSCCDYFSSIWNIFLYSIIWMWTVY